jgi:hypothetical protein
MTPEQNKKYNDYFEKHCRRVGGHFRIELEDLPHLTFSTPLIPEHTTAPYDGNQLNRGTLLSREYLWPFIKYPTYTNQ